MAEIVVVEDETNLRSLFEDVLTRRGHHVVAFASLAAAQAHLSAQLPDVLLLDVKLPDGDGLVLLESLRKRKLRVPTVVMTAFGTIDRAVQALRAGATDFLVKPFDNARLVLSVEGAVAASERLEELELSAGTVEDSEAARPLIGAEGGLRAVVALLPRVAATDATVLITGESGTGKELVARAIHAASPRLDGPFQAVNCAALPASLLESELFGFERGAFTGAHARRIGLIESANGGTLFLDEIGDMSIEAQARLLRVLQERELVRIGGRDAVKVDVRVVAATHRDLDALVKSGGFRSDLLFRLNVVPIRLPPLRDRTQDLPALLGHFLERHARRHRLEALQPSAEVLGWVRLQSWPGNVRELENWAERAVVLQRFEVSGPVAVAPTIAPAGVPVRSLHEAVAEAERNAVLAALRSTKGNKTEAARVLGISYKTLFNKLHEHGIREEPSFE